MTMLSVILKDETRVISKEKRELNCVVSGTRPDTHSEGEAYYDRCRNCSLVLVVHLDGQRDVKE